MSSSCCQIPKARYTEEIDYRCNLFDIDSFERNPELIERVQKQARSVACIVNMRKLVGSDDLQYYELSPSVRSFAEENRKEGFEKTIGEPFMDEPVIAEGTAFLITNRLVLTAGHCVCEGKGRLLTRDQIARKEFYDLDEDWRKGSYIVFDVQMRSSNHWPDRIARHSVYGIKKIADYQYVQMWDEKCARSLHIRDWAVIELDREVDDRDPFELDFSSEVVCDDRVYMLGYPTGFPLKFTSNGVVVKTDHEYYFEAMIDAFGGNSGSPLICYKTGKVVGILSNGNDDYQPDRESSTRKVKVISAEITDKYGFEKCQKIASIKQLERLFSSGRFSESGRSLAFRELETPISVRIIAITSLSLIIIAVFYLHRDLCGKKRLG